MSTPAASITKAPKGGRSSARLSGKSLLDQRRSAFKASSSIKGPSKAGISVGIVSLDSPPSKVSGVKRKASLAPDFSSGTLKERSVEDLVGFGDAEARKEIGDLHPIDCVNEAVVGAWKIFQYSLVASTTIQELSDQSDRKVARLEEQLKTSESRSKFLEHELSTVKQDRDVRLEGLKAEMQVKIGKLREDDGRVAADVGAYYCLKSRIEMMDEFAAGSHVDWKVDDARADMEMMYPDGNPGAELFKFAGLCVEDDKEGTDQGGVEAVDGAPQADQEANSGMEIVPAEKSGES